jgi:hypothetical protein
VASSKLRFSALLSLILGILVSAVSLFAVLHHQDSDSSLALQQVVNQCPASSQEIRHTCYTEHILLTAEHQPAQTGRVLNGLRQLSVDGRLQDDPRGYSDVAHEAGMLLEYKKVDIQTAYADCGYSFKAACMHGYVMDEVDDHYPGDAGLQKALGLCTVFKDFPEKSNCIHGLGHEIAARTTAGLGAALDRCGVFSPDMQPACQSGVMMEYTKGTAGSGHHSHLPVGRLKLPCPDLAQNYQAVCYSASASYRQYYPNEEAFATTYDYCTAAPSQYVVGCMMGVSERVIIATAENGAKARAVCNALKDQKTTCLKAMIATSKQQFTSPKLTNELEGS